jgi:Polyketide cyclase / dehydrase and lipid transport
MARIAGELVINRPVDEVFDFVADERNEPRYNPRIRRAEKLSPGPIGRGTRFRAEAVTRGRTVGMTIDYTAYERPRQLGSSIHMAAADILGTLRFDPVPDGTRMSWSWEMRLRGLYRLLTPIIVGAGRRQEQANWAGLKRFLEGQQSLVGNTEAERDLRQAQAMRSVR